MGSQSVRPVAGTIQSHPVPECTACPGILAESCKHEWTLCSRADSIGSKIRVRTGVGVKGHPSHDYISAGDATSEAKMRKFYCEVCRSLAHTCATSSGETSTVTAMKLRHAEPRKSSVPARHFASSSVPPARRYGNSLMREDGDKIELMGMRKEEAERRPRDL